MGSYLSAPMLVFRLAVLPRTCETPCSDGPAGHLMGSSGLYYFSRLFRDSPRQPPRRTVFFISSYFAVARYMVALAPYPPIVSGYFSRHFPYSISSCISWGPMYGHGRRVGITRIYGDACGKISRNAYVYILARFFMIVFEEPVTRG